jgi:eukaryotic-like serine/threonine-protein kinase
MRTENPLAWRLASPATGAPVSHTKRSASESGVVPLPVPPPAESRYVGQVIAGKYRIDKVISWGGMGVVLRAQHLALDEPVVIKVLRPALMEEDGMVARFTREARAASKIKSDHVVRVMDVHTLKSGMPIIVMEYLEGTDLTAVLREQGKLPIEIAVRYVLEACDAIAEAHELGIIHRDLKPGNLFLARRRDGKSIIKVLDFGISKFAGVTLSDEDSTKPGTMLGSPRFMSPEQMMSIREVDGRADIWSLGAILYKLLTGVAPFGGDTMPQVCSLVLNADPLPPDSYRSEIPAELADVVLRCLEKNPAKRFATVAELVEALEPWSPKAMAPAPRFMSEPPKLSLSEDSGIRVSAQHTAVTVSVNPPPMAPKRRLSERILGGLVLSLVLALAAVVIAPRVKPTAASAALPESSSPLSTTALQPADPPSPVVTAAVPAPSSTGSAAVEPSPTGAASVGSAPSQGKKPGAPAWKTKADPFKGSRF